MSYRPRLYGRRPRRETENALARPRPFNRKKTRTCVRLSEYTRGACEGRPAPYTIRYARIGGGGGGGRGGGGGIARRVCVIFRYLLFGCFCFLFVCAAVRNRKPSSGRNFPRPRIAFTGLPPRFERAARPFRVETIRFPRPDARAVFVFYLCTLLFFVFFSRYNVYSGKHSRRASRRKPIRGPLPARCTVFVRTKTTIRVGKKKKKTPTEHTTRVLSYRDGDRGRPGDFFTAVATARGGPPSQYLHLRRRFDQYNDEIEIQRAIRSKSTAVIGSSRRTIDDWVQSVPGRSWS